MDELTATSKIQLSGHEDPFQLFGELKQPSQKLADHRAWLSRIRHERPSTAWPYKVGVYIRYFNQTRYPNYLDYHKQQYLDTLKLCPYWTFAGFYIDEGQSPPNMERAPAWSRLLTDCTDGRVDLIVTQKVSNVSRQPEEIAFCARMLAAQDPPIGIYFISEDIFTLASYYQENLRNEDFLPDPDWNVFPTLEELENRLGGEPDD